MGVLQEGSSCSEFGCVDLTWMLIDRESLGSDRSSNDFLGLRLFKCYAVLGRGVYELTFIYNNNEKGRSN